MDVVNAVLEGYPKSKKELYVSEVIVDISLTIVNYRKKLG